MKKLVKWVSVSALGISLSGCSATNISKFVTAVGKDKATWKIHVMTPYGSGDYTRIGEMVEGQSCTVSPDGSITITGRTMGGDGSNVLSAPLKATVTVHQ